MWTSGSGRGQVIGGRPGSAQWSLGNRVVAAGQHGSPVSLTTRGFAVSRAECVTTAIAAVVSSTSYVIGGLPYLSRGVVGDLTGFLLLGAAGAAAGARVQHEAAVCLVLIGGVIVLNPEWPLRVREPRW